MAARNADSMTNAQGEFKPTQPRDEPLTTHGHQPGQKVSPADHAPEFSAQTLPAGSAPSSKTFQPNTSSETPGQGNNPSVLRSHGKEDVSTSASSTLVGATSADVHTGLGHPGQGQTSNELRHDGAHTRTKQRSGPEGAGAPGGSGLTGGDDSLNTEFRRLQEDSGHPRGPLPGHNATLSGAESKEPVGSAELASEGGKGPTALNPTNKSTNASGVADRGTGNDHQA
ncbi:hypothetical protein B0A52_07009 [Exophiala mesophila]|uniref:Uncharacterized protein n=1 Tax=Exophiala mesophila TaxID=212818 RepID=A0A438MXV1_EXOME|nr:hypothetical protein B0A52_07009 [Exophiala mesophila]